MIFDGKFAPLPASLRTPISNIQFENYPYLTGLSRCLLALLATIYVLATKAHSRHSEIFFGHYLALDHIIGWQDPLSCAFHANASEIR